MPSSVHLPVAVALLLVACSAGGGASDAPGPAAPGPGAGGMLVSPGSGGTAPVVGPGGAPPLIVGSSGGAAASGPEGGVIRSEDCGKVTAIIRDFSTAHADFEMTVAFDLFNPATWVTQGQKGIVTTALASGYPSYAHTGATPQTTGPLEFYQWYVDTPGVNMTVRVPLTLTETSPGVFVYDSASFFPVDGQGFGNDGNNHNFHFTTEVRTLFTYHGGEQFTFRGDDDLWVFVNGHLVMDLGGLHGPQQETVQMDAVSRSAGLTAGQTYPMDLFHAERHTSESNFRIETSIDCFVEVEPPPPPPPPIIR